MKMIVRNMKHSLFCPGKLPLAVTVSLLLLATATAQRRIYDLPDRLKAARELYENDMFVAAEKEFTALLEAYPAEGLSRSELEGYRLLCRIRMEAPDMDGLVAEFAERYPYSPELARARFHQSCCYFRRGEYAKALEIMSGLENGYLREDERLEFLFNRAFCRLRVGRLEESASGFEKILTLERNEFSASAAYYLAYIRYVMKDFRETIPLFEGLLQDQRYGTMSAYYLLESRFMLEDYDYVTRKGPGVYDVLAGDFKARTARMISEAWFALDRPQKAQQYLELYSESGARLTRKDRYYSGLLSYSLGSYYAAADAFSQVGGGPDSLSQSASYYLGNTYLQLKNKHAALDAFRAASAQDADRTVREESLFHYAKLAFDVNGDITVFERYLQEYPSSSRSDEIQSYIAASFLLSKDYVRALDALAKIRTMTPAMKQNAQKAAFFRGLQLFERGAYRNAAECFEQSLRYGGGQASLEQLTRFWLAEACFRTNDFARSAEIGRELLRNAVFRRSAEYPTGIYNLAYAYFRLENYSEALLYFQDYLALPPSRREFSPEARTRMADCYFMLREYDRAAELYEQVAAMEYDRNNLYPRYQGALCYGLLSEPERKIDLLDGIVSEKPDSPIYPLALFELGRTYVQTGDNARAKDCYRLLTGPLRDSVYYTKAMLELGMIAANESDYERALSCYSTIVEQYPLSEESPSALAGMESIYMRLNKPEEYLAYLERVGMSSLKSTDEKEQMFFNAAEQQFLAENYLEARRSLEAYLRRYPDGAKNSQAWFYLAECQRQTGRPEAAADAYQKVMKLGDGSFAELATLNYARLCYDMEKYAEAVLAYETLSRIARLDNNRFEAQVGLMRAYFRNASYREAVSSAESVSGAVAAPEALRREALYIRAKSFLALGQRAEALPLLDRLSREWVTEEGAEAAYLLIQDACDAGDFDKVEELVYRFSDSGTPHTYWLAKSFIVLGDSFAEREEWEQARATFESIVEGYSPLNPHDDVLQQVAIRMERLPSAAAGAEAAAEQLIQ